jgi:type II secretory pathway component GspD/PulD (secretin)
MGDFLLKKKAKMPIQGIEAIRKGRSVMARKNITKILSGVCIVLCTVLFCTLNAHASGVTITVQKFTVSGSMGVEGVELIGFPGNQSVITDSSGYYSVEVEYGKTFSVKPAKPGYTFTPANRTYNSIDKVQPNQDYKATVMTYTVSGKVDNMAGVQLNGLPGNPATGADGSYSVIVNYDFECRIEPFKDGYEFTPSFFEIGPVHSNIVQNFSVSPIRITISGNLGTKGVEMTGLPTRVVSGDDGSYTVDVDYRWSGTVVPKKDGYAFEPTDTVYQNLTSDQLQDYGAKPQQFVISGTAGITGAKMEGLPGDVFTDSAGFYTTLVDYDFSGTVKPVLEGHSFKPASITYTKVTSNKENQDYKSSIETYVIKGKTGIAGVTMNGLPDNTVTVGPDGSYSVTVEYGFNGLVSPQKDGYDFQPSERDYSNVAQNYEQQDYLSSLKQYTVNGNAGEPGVALRGFPGKAVESDESGNFTVKVPHGWTGKITPSKNGMEFEPRMLDISNVTSDLDNENFQAKPIMFEISGTITSDKGKPVEGIVMFTDGSLNATTDARGKFTLSVPYNWTGSVMPNPEREGYSFQPQSYIYDVQKAVKRNITNANFKAIIQMFKITDVLEYGEGVPLSGVQITANPGDIKTVSKANGEFTIEVPYGWTGEYTLSKPGIEFNPKTVSFTTVTQNYYKNNPVESGTTPRIPTGGSTKPANGTTPGGTTPGGTTPGGTTPGGTTPGGTTPGGTTPGGTTPGGTTPGGVTPGGTTPGSIPGGTTPGGETKGTGTPTVEDMIKAEINRRLGAEKPTAESVTPQGEVIINDTFTNTDLLTVLDTLSSLSKIPIIYEDTISGNINCALDHVPFTKALEMVLASTPYYFKKIEGNPSYYLVCAGRITDQKFLQISETKRKRLDYIPATTAKNMLALPFRDYVQADTDPNGRLITITAPGTLLNTIMAQLETFDVKPSQVLLEARFVVMEKGDLLNLGVEWGWPTMQSGLASNDNKGGVLDLAGGTAWGIQVGYSPDASFTNSLDQILNLLKVNDEATIISRPTILAQDDKQARIRVLTEDYYILYAPGLADNYYSRQEMATIITGTVLTITPHIGDINDIVLDMAVEVSDSIPKSRESDLPKVTRRTTENILRVEDGGTVAISGLSENRVQKTEKKVPGLGNIPVLGDLLFTNRYNNNNSKEVAVFVTASIVHESNPMEMDFTKRSTPGTQAPVSAGNPSYQSINSMDAGMNTRNMPRSAQPRSAQPRAAQPQPSRTSSFDNNYNQNQDPFMGFPDAGNNMNYQQRPVRTSPEDDFRGQLRGSMMNQNQYNGGGF